jgi:hypothetical protein
MVHYIITPSGDSEQARQDDFNRHIDAFDIDGFIAQFESTQADWLLFTFGQNSGYYCSPNPVLDERLSGRTSRRDLMLEIAERVKGLGKRMLLYLPAEVKGQSDAVRQAFAWQDGNLVDFMTVYLDFVQAYSIKFADRHDGWWFDGCYEHHYTSPGWDWQRWLDAARAGNDKSIVAFNDGAFCTGKFAPVTPLEDYHAGEVHLLDEGQIRADYLHLRTTLRDGKKILPGGDAEPVYYMPAERFIDGVQWHALCPIDSSFNPRLYHLSYSDDFLFKWVADCKRVGGAVTLNAPIDISNGRIPDSTIRQLQRLGKFLNQ